MKNTEARKTVKTVFGFILVVLLIAASICGFELPFGVEDVIPQETVPQSVQTTPPPAQTQPAESENVNMVVPVEDTNVCQPSATAQTETQLVETSADTIVAEPTEAGITATEGEIVNA